MGINNTANTIDPASHALAAPAAGFGPVYPADDAAKFTAPTLVAPAHALLA